MRQEKQDATRRSIGRRIVWMLLLCALMIGVGASIGLVVGQFRLWPYNIIWNVYRIIKTERLDTPDYIRTKFIDLDVVRFEGRRPVKFNQAGGLTAYHENALLLEGGGDIYFVDIGGLKTTRLNITVPANGEAALMSRPYDGEEPEYKRFRYHRYNAIMYYDDRLYVTFSNYDEKKQCFTLRLARLRVDGPIEKMTASGADWEIIFESKPCFEVKERGQPYAGHQAGGAMAVSPKEGALYVTVGDYEFDGYNGENFPQDENVDYGKVWRLDLRSGEMRVFSVGHRNSQGIVVKPNGEIWATEHGPEGGDELNYVMEGGNYGWPNAVYGTQYGRRTWPAAKRQGSHEGYKEPAWAWMPSVATSGISYIEGFDPIWDGGLIVGSLKGASLFRIVTAGEHVVTFERIEIGERVRDVLVHSGYLLVHTDQGHLLRLGARESQESERLKELVAGLSEGAERELGRCLECHGRGQSEVAPNLCGVLGRGVGQSSFTGYSDGMAAHGGSWDKALLAAFLRDGTAVVAGTTMPDSGIEGVGLREEIVENMDFFCD